MTSKEAFNKLQHYINGTKLSGEEYLECCKILDKGLDRLEKLEKTIELLKTRVKMFEIHHGPKSRYYYLYIGGRIVFLSREEYELLKEVLENGI